MPTPNCYYWKRVLVSVYGLRRLRLTSFKTQLVFEVLAEAESGMDVATETSLLSSLCVFWNHQKRRGELLSI